MPRSASHPVPDLPHVRGGVLKAHAIAAAPTLPTFSADRLNYIVGEAPLYRIDNAPAAQPVHWSIRRDGQTPVAFSDPSQQTDASGHWSGLGDPWTAETTGFYSVSVQVGDWNARTCFTVIQNFDAPRVESPSDLIGVTHVAGDYRFAGPGTPFGDVPFLVEGAQRILNLGARRGFFYLTPQYQSSDYRFDDFGPDPISALVQLAKSPPYRQLFDQPFEQFVLTIYTFANWKWILDRAQGGRSVPFDAGAETAEIAGLVAHLAREYPGKRFILKNWEGDWQLQESFDINSIATAERIREFIGWMRARQAGVVQGRGGAASADSIQHAIEFNLLSRSARDLPGVLRDVVSSVDSDLVSYSSWDTSGEFDTRRMKDAIAFIKGAPGTRGRKLLIAEFGVVNNPPDPKAAVDSDSLIQAFLEMGVNAFFWEIFNNGVPFGLVGPEFQHFDTWFTLRRALGGRNDAAVVHDPALTTVPSVIEAAQTLPVTVTFRNTGPTWYRSVGYQLELMGAEGADLGERAFLPSDVPASAQVTFKFDFTAPSEPGGYRFQLAQRGIEVFGEALEFAVGEGAAVARGAAPAG